MSLCSPGYFSSPVAELMYDQPLVITPSSSGHKAGCLAVSPDPEAL